jgi:hypothetical protein
MAALICPGGLLTMIARDPDAAGHFLEIPHPAA